MKAIEFRQLDEKDEEITDALIYLGMSRPVARTLSYLKNADGLRRTLLRKVLDCANLKSALP